MRRAHALPLRRARRDFNRLQNRAICAIGGKPPVCTANRQFARQTANWYLPRDYIQNTGPVDRGTGGPPAGPRDRWTAGWTARQALSIDFVAAQHGGGRAERQACRSRHPPRTIFLKNANTHVDALQTTARTSARTSARTCDRSNCPIGKRETVVL